MSNTPEVVDYLLRNLNLIEGVLGRLLRLEHLILERTDQMAIDLTKLNEAVAAIESRLAALATQVADLTAQVAAGSTTAADQAAVDAVAAKLSTDAAPPA